MAKLEDIPKKEFFKVSDEYFEKLPGRISERVAEHPRRSVTMQYVIRYALPVILIAAAIFWYLPQSSSNAEDMLASIDTDVMIDYLYETGMTTDDMLESLEFTEEDLDAFEFEDNDLINPDQP